MFSYRTYRILANIQYYDWGVSVMLRRMLTMTMRTDAASGLRGSGASINYNQEQSTPDPESSDDCFNLRRQSSCLPYLEGKSWTHQVPWTSSNRRRVYGIHTGI